MIKFAKALLAFSQSSIFCLEIAACDELPGKLIPRASIADAIVFAVYIPPQEPGPGIAFVSILVSSFFVIRPFENSPTASKTETISIFLLLCFPGIIVPP